MSEVSSKMLRKMTSCEFLNAMAQSMTFGLLVIRMYFFVNDPII